MSLKVPKGATLFPKISTGFLPLSPYFCGRKKRPPKSPNGGLVKPQKKLNRVIAVEESARSGRNDDQGTKDG